MVSVHAHGCNRMPQAGWLISNRNVFLPVLETGRSKRKLPADMMFGPLSGS